MSVYPVILFDRSSGSDDEASGAGPSTAEFGIEGEWTDGGAGNPDVFTLADPMMGSVDLSGVAVDGSHVIWVGTSTGRKFFTITAKDESAFTVTVAQQVAGDTTGLSWAIGGKRASLAGSSELYASGGDVHHGWIYELGSGYTETFSATINWYAGTSSADPVIGTGEDGRGQLLLRGESGGTRPILTWTNNGPALIVKADYQKFKFFEMRNTWSGGTELSSGIDATDFDVVIEDIKIDHSTSTFGAEAIGIHRSGAAIVRNCSIRTLGNGIELGDDANYEHAKNSIIGNYIHDCGGVGLYFHTVDFSSMQLVLGNLIVDNGSHGLHIQNLQSDTFSGFAVINNTIDGNTGDGIRHEFYASQSYRSYTCDVMLNNICSNNGGYGINFQGWTSAYEVATLGAIFDNNNTYNNTSGATTHSALLQNDPGLDPSFTNSSGGDYSIGTNLKGEGYSESNIAGSSTRSYVDIGAAQRQEAGGGTTTTPQLINGGLVS